MKKNKQKFKIRNIVFLIAVILFCNTLYNQQIDINKYNSKLTMLENDIDEASKLYSYYLEKEKEERADEYYESIARDSLGLVKSYEKIFIDINK